MQGVWRRGRKKGEIHLAAGRVVNTLCTSREENSAGKAWLSHCPTFHWVNLEVVPGNTGCAELPALCEEEPQTPQILNGD